MKRIGILFTCIVTALPFISVNQINAQVQVTRGSTHHYSVAPISGPSTYNYNWSVTPGGTTSGFGTKDTTNDVVWNGATGLYTITVYPTHQVSGCAGSNQTLIVDVVDMNIIWSSTNSIQCPKTDNQSGDFTLFANYTGLTGAWSFKYSIDGTAEQTVNIAAGNSATVIIDGFVNPSVTIPAIHTIRISSVTTPDNYTLNYTGAESDAAARLYTVTVDPTPNTSGIIQL
jgi:hypothetical protein